MEDLQVSVVEVVHQERCNAVANVAALMEQKTVIAIVTAQLDLLLAVNVVKASQESVLQLAVGSVHLEWLLFVLVVEAVLRQEADLVATDLLVEEAVQEAIVRQVVVVALVETVHHLQEGCPLLCLVEQMG